MRITFTTVTKRKHPALESATRHPEFKNKTEHFLFNTIKWEFVIQTVSSQPLYHIIHGLSLSLTNMWTHVLHLQRFFYFSTIRLCLRRVQKDFFLIWHSLWLCTAFWRPWMEKLCSVASGLLIYSEDKTVLSHKLWCPRVHGGAS